MYLIIGFILLWIFFGISSIRATIVSLHTGRDGSMSPCKPDAPLANQTGYEDILSGEACLIEKSKSKC